MNEHACAIDAHGERVQDMFTRIAHGYDRANHWMSLGIDIRWRRRAVSRLLESEHGADKRVLDLCAGTLDSTLEIHAQYPEASIVAGDFSARMLDMGTRKLVGRSAQCITTAVMDAHSLPEGDACLDAIFCAFGIRNLSDLERATREQARCLRPGGRLVVLEFFRPTSLSARLFHATYNRTVLPLVGWATTGHLDAYLYLPRSIGGFAKLEDYLELLATCGFEPILCERFTFGIAWSVTAIRTAGTNTNTRAYGGGHP